MGHSIILGCMFMGLLASSGYLVYCRRENRAREQGAHDETLLSDDTEPDTPACHRDERIARSKEIRKQRINDLNAQGLVGKLKAVRAALDEGSGGVYADVDEARSLKGDAWSGFRQRLLCFPSSRKYARKPAEAVHLIAEYRL
jgi:hypothetical protein